MSAADDDDVPAGGRALLLGVGLPDDSTGATGHLFEVWFVRFADDENLTGLLRDFHKVETTSRYVLEDPTEVRLLAGLRLAGVDAVVVLASLVGRALLVTLAFTLDAVDLGVSQEPWWTRASVSADALPSADGVRAAWVGNARVWSLYALVVLADESGVAVGINLALGLAPGDGVRLGNKPFQAPTDGVSKLVGHAHCSRTTRGWVARIWFFNTPLIGANEAGATVGVNQAFRFAAGDGVRVGNEPRFTSANRVSNRVDHTNGSRATG